MDEAFWRSGVGQELPPLPSSRCRWCSESSHARGRALAGGLPRFGGVQNVHRAAALIGLILVVVHMLSLLADPYAQLQLVDFIFPLPR